jgi:four helix bundle protein
MFGLAAQARRASTSISINIAEGSCKKGRAEFRRYLDIALGSLAETEALRRFARDLQLDSADAIKCLEIRREETGKILWARYEATLNGRGRPKT